MNTTFQSRLHFQVKNFLFAVILLTVAFLASGSDIIRQTGIQDYNSIRDRKINLLENLEKGKPVDSEEIRSSFSHDSDNPEPFVPFDEEFGELFENLKTEINSFENQSGCLHNPEEFNNAMDQFRKEMEKFRKDLGKMFDGMRKLRVETGESDEEGWGV